MERSEYKLGEKSLTIHFGNQNPGDEFILTYQLYDHSLNERWWALLELSMFDQGVFGTIGFMGQILDDEELIVTTLNYYILKINSFVKKHNYPELIIEHTIEKGVAQNILNELHRYFEIYSIDERLEKPLRNTFKFLNIFIHKMENFSDGKKNNCVIIDVSPVELQFLPILTDEFKLISPDWHWGELCLNYSQLGVPTLQAFLNNSKPRPQSYFSSAMYLTFVDDSPFERYDELSKWLITKNLSLNDPKSAIGYILLGKLMTPTIPVTDDERISFLLNFKKYNTIKKIDFNGKSSQLKILPVQFVPAQVDNERL
ncbi:MAG: hypothetical protein HOP07_08860 [Bacteriovoracaceae bacterium]|nr:hypothetical protein [Bacteriovoracaceae bacterium]